MYNTVIQPSYFLHLPKHSVSPVSSSDLTIDLFLEAQLTPNIISPANQQYVKRSSPHIAIFMLLKQHVTLHLSLDQLCFVNTRLTFLK